MSETGQEELDRLTQKLLRERAVDFRDYKPATLRRRIQRRVQSTGCADIADYSAYLDRWPDEYDKLVDSILINVTEFFREPEAWDFLRANAMPQILGGRRPGDQIRIWSAGCATGEEAYSLAIMISEMLSGRAPDYDVRIFATDIDERALSIARRGEYAEADVKSLGDDLARKYFSGQTRCTVSREIRKMVVFGRHNLITDAPISHVDLIVCRNVLIYMTAELQSRLLSRLHYALEPDGYLFLGKAESLLSASRLFSPVKEKWRIFRKESAIGSTGANVQEDRVVAQAAENGGAEYQVVSDFNEAVLRYIPTGVIAIDEASTVRAINPAAEAIWGVRAEEVLGRSLFETELPPCLSAALPAIARARSRRTEVRIDEMDIGAEHPTPLSVAAIVAPMFNVLGTSVGVVLVAENITDQVRLRTDLGAANEELETANEELQATNEELQSTNEELATTNEELQSTNEELQSTNEELQATNEELQATNEELSTTNDELADRTVELDFLTLCYGGVVNNVDVPLVVLDENDVVTMWSSAAEEFYALPAAEAVNKSFLDLRLSVGVSGSREKLSRIRRTRRPYKSRPVEYEAESGETCRVVIEYMPLIDARDQYRGTICTARDAGSNGAGIPIPPRKRRD